MAKKNQQKQGLLARVAGGGANKGGKRRGGNRPRGEGRGFVDSILALVRRK